MESVQVELPEVRVVDTRQIVEKGKAIYQQLREKLEEEYLGRFAAIDVESGDYFVGKTLTEADKKAREKYPDRVFYAVRVGRPAVYVYR
jgi:hypothetical protein